MLELSRYIVLNPVRAGMVRSARDWPWSSYRATAGQAKAPGFLQTDWLLAGFGRRKSSAIEKYKQFVSEGKGQPSPWQALRHQVFLGDEHFVCEMQSLIDGEKEFSEIPSTQRRSVAKLISEYEKSSANRNAAIANAYRSGRYTLKELGEFLIYTIRR